MLNTWNESVELTSWICLCIVVVIFTIWVGNLWLGVSFGCKVMNQVKITCYALLSLLCKGIDLSHYQTIFVFQRLFVCTPRVWVSNAVIGFRVLGLNSKCRSGSGRDCFCTQFVLGLGFVFEFQPWFWNLEFPVSEVSFKVSIQGLAFGVGGFGSISSCDPWFVGSNHGLSWSPQIKIGDSGSKF